MTGIQQAIVDIARQSLVNAMEDRKHFLDIMAGRVPADSLHTVRVADEVHKSIIAANRAQIELIKAKYGGQA